MFNRVFFGWRVVTAAFVVAVFGWGVGFYGPPILLHVIHETRGWPVSLVSAAITSHFLLGAVFVVNLPRAHERFGVALVTGVCGGLSGVGVLVWALASQPWQLFVASVVTGLGWAGTGGAAVNAIVSPWFDRRRPAALSMAYNGASVGGVLFSVLWVILIAALGLPGAALVSGVSMATCVAILAYLYLRPSPESLGLYPDGESGAPLTAARRDTGVTPLPGALLYRDRRFVTICAGMSLGLFAQIGLISHLYSVLVPAFGQTWAGGAVSYATVCAVAGRTLVGALMPPGADRRRVAAIGYLIQALGCTAFIAAGGSHVMLLLVGVTLFGSGIGNATSLPPLIAQVEFTVADTTRVVALVMGISQATFAFAPAAFSLLREDSTAAHPATPWLFAAAAGIQLAAAAAMLAGRAGQR